MSLRSQTFSLGLVIILAAIAASAMAVLAAELKDPLTPLKSTEGSMLCSQRDYSAEHLARHPKQTVKSVLLAFQQGFVTLVLTPRSGAPKLIGGGCDWREGASIDTSGHKMIPNFNKAAGFDCMVVIGNSAEERGYFLIDPAPDAKSLMLFLQSPIGVDSGEPGNSRGSDLTLGPQDRTFALRRINAKACAKFKATVE